MVLGVTTASLMDDRAQSESFELESLLRFRLDHLVLLDRPEISAEVGTVKPKDQNVVCLTGASPRWWDTRYSRLLFDPGHLRFSTVA